MYLLITESPVKAKKIQSFLGSTYKVISSCGHIRDLDKKSLSIDVNNDFKPSYKNISDKKDIIKSLKLQSKGTTVILAADDDREGEAIAWHCAKVVGVPIQSNNRITYREISRQAILDALQQPREIDMCEVNAQQARRIIDRLIGFKLSPCLWKHIQNDKMPTLSAGRVQSALLDLLDKREQYINTYEPNVILTIHGVFADLKDCEYIFEKKYNVDDVFIRTLFTLFSMNRQFTVVDHSSSREKTYPRKPLITSTLLQSAQNELGFPAKMTMDIAQRLYEGGHITYMRTDSTFISEEFQTHLERKIKKEYGEGIYQKSTERKVKGAQEAHEAIRPTELFTIPDLNKTDMKLYLFILKRTITSHMKPAEYDVYKIHMSNPETKEYGYFSTNIRQLQIPGYLQYGKDTFTIESEPQIKVKDTYHLKECFSSEKEESEPNHYNESDIVKLLEDTGIGRPSTYVAIIDTIGNRKYSINETIQKKDRSEQIIRLNPDDSLVEEEIPLPGKSMKRRIQVTSLGRKVLSYLRDHFSIIIHKDFTSGVEKDLDLISRGEADWIDIIRKVYDSFIDVVDQQMSLKVNKTMKLIGVKKGLTIYLGSGKYGPYLQIKNNETRAKQNKSIGSYLRLIHKDETDLTLNDCIQFLKHPKQITDDITIHIGPYGYYLKHKNKNYKIHQKGTYSENYCLQVINK